MTVNNQLSVCFNYAVRFYGLAKKPVVQCGPFGKGKADEMQFRTREEFYQFIGAVDKPAARLAFEILFWSGIRRYEMDKGCEKSGVKRIRVHDLRHFHASMLIEIGYSPLLISERLGHENIQTTLQTYSHLYPDKQQEFASQMEESEAEKYADILSAFEKKEPPEK